jgi:hypothetical protein
MYVIFGEPQFKRTQDLKEFKQVYMDNISLANVLKSSNCDAMKISGSLWILTTETWLLCLLRKKKSSIFTDRQPLVRAALYSITFRLPSAVISLC